MGSPPPMRGKDIDRFPLVVRLRITPAYAGKSSLAFLIGRRFKDHPRLCGEKSPFNFYHLYQMGSPPPMRGKADTSVLYGSETRITPAYAGKSAEVLHSFNALWDHPRLCGEKAHPLEPQVLRQGSPPPMRGKGFLLWCTQCRSGITPAYAGKRPGKQVFPGYPRDHPRLSGEKCSLCV